MIKILLVDDDHDDQTLFQEVIREISPEIICETADDGEEALNLLHHADIKPDLVFLDINMPKMNGKRCLKLMRAEKALAALKVVVMSTFISDQDEVLFDKYNAQYMRKPNEYEKLVAQLRKFILPHISYGTSTSRG